MKIILWIRDHIFISIIIAIGVFLVPLIIVNILFKCNPKAAFLIAEWDAGDLLSYIAGFEAFLGTSILGMVTIWQSNQANKINDKLLILNKNAERLSVIPFLTFNKYNAHYKGDVIDFLLDQNMQSPLDDNDESLCNNSLQREDHLIQEVVYTVKRDGITVADMLSREQEKSIQSTCTPIPDDNGMRLVQNKSIYIKLCVRNDGKGAAVNLKCRIVKDGCDGKNAFDVYTNPFSVSPNQHFDLGIYFDDISLCKNKYIIQFQYFDVFFNQYTQNINLVINENGQYTMDLHIVQEFNS